MPIADAEEGLLRDAIKVLKHLDRGAAISERMAVHAARRVAQWIVARVPETLEELPRGYLILAQRGRPVLAHQCLTEDFMLGCTGRAARKMARDCATGWIGEIGQAVKRDLQRRSAFWSALKQADREEYAEREALWHAIQQLRP